MIEALKDAHVLKWLSAIIAALFAWVWRTSHKLTRLESDVEVLQKVDGRTQKLQSEFIDHRARSEAQLDNVIELLKEIRNDRH